MVENSLIMKEIKGKRQLINLRDEFKLKNIGLCHGSFDIIHLGHLNHFKEAKSKVDKLIVSVTADKYIDKGDGRPFNNEEKRIKFLNHIKEVDYIYLDRSNHAVNIINTLKPDFYFKGIDYKKKDIGGNLNKEISALKKNKGKFYITNSKKYSSTKIFQNVFSNLDKEHKEILNKISKKFNFEKIKNLLETLKNKEITIIGEPIIDSYQYCTLVGLTSKDPAISTIIKDSDSYLGGVISNAIVASQFLKTVNLITYGKSKKLNGLKKFKNIKVINISNNKKIQLKTRFINENRLEKLLQVTNFKKNYFSEFERDKAIKILSNIKGSLIVCDYGLGFFEKTVLKNINKSKIKKYVNVQTNSLNLGVNLFSKYSKPNYFSLDVKEWQLGIKIDDINIDNVINFFGKKEQNFSYTMGKKGSILYYKKKIYKSPAFAKNVVDVTGCGDAYFIISSILLDNKFDPDLSVFISNMYAALYSKFLANSKTVDKNTLLRSIRNFLGD